MRQRTVATLLATFAVVGCSTSARSPSFQGQDVTPAPRLTASEVQSNKQVLLIDGDLPEGVTFKVLGEVRVNAGRVSSVQRMYKELALRGRYVGADAIVNINYKIRVAPFVAGAPSISGVAIQIESQSKEDLKALETNNIQNTESWLLKVLKDSDSAKVRDVYISNAAIPIICGEVNAKNSMGGYTGFKKFYYGGNDQLAQIEAADTEDAFEMRYANLCNGKRKSIALDISSTPVNLSVADELQKLHLLMEQKIITQEEFDRQKARLLK